MILFTTQGFRGKKARITERLIRERWNYRNREVEKIELQKDRITERQNYRKTELQKDRKTELQKDRITERQNYENKDLFTNLIKGVKMRAILSSPAG